MDNVVSMTAQGRLECYGFYLWEDRAMRRDTPGGHVLITDVEGLDVPDAYDSPCLVGLFFNDPMRSPMFLEYDSITEFLTQGDPGGEKGVYGDRTKKKG
jgi:hypothetical protein